MRGATESKWGQETDPQGRDLQALDRPDELYAAADYPKPGEAGQDACALAQLRVAALRFLRWQPGVGLAKALTDSPENPVAAPRESPVRLERAISQSRRRRGGLFGEA